MDDNVEIMEAVGDRSEHEQGHVGEKTTAGCKRRKLGSALLTYYEKEKALQIVRNNDYNTWVKNLSQELWDDEEVVMAAVTRNSDAFRYASLRLRGKPEIIMKALDRRDYNLFLVHYAAPHLFFKNSRKFVLSLIQSNPRCFQYLPRIDSVDIDWRDDKELALAVLDGDKNQVEHLTRRLRNDRDIILASVGGRWFSLMLRGALSEFEDAKLRALLDEEIIRKAVRIDPSFLVHASQSHRNDRRIALAAIESGRKHGLDSLSDNLKADRELNLLAAQHCGCILSFPVFGGDREIVITALSKDGSIWQRISEELQGDAEVALVAITQYPGLYRSLPDEFKANRTIALKAVSKGFAHQLPFLFVEFQGDREVVWTAIQSYRQKNKDCLDDITWFGAASEELRSDRDIFLEALSIDFKALQYVPKALSNSPEIFASAIRFKPPWLRQEQMLGYVMIRIGNTLRQQLDAVHEEFMLEDAHREQIELIELQDADKWLRMWKQRLWHKVWLLNEVAKPAVLPDDTRKAILMFSDILPDFRLAHRLSDVAPVVEALAERGANVGDLLDATMDSDSDSSQDSHVRGYDDWYSDSDPLNWYTDSDRSTGYY
ncbi:hypothetical protein ACHAWF_011512 [Thalassiosira exigua]